jgi:hypothetical protein
MAELLILEFSAPAAVDLYNRVNELLGVDPATGQGEWPAGMIDHHGAGEGDTLVVVESWETREAQEAFMRDRLMPAFGQANVPQPTRVTWLPEVGRLVPSTSAVPQPREQVSQ